MQLSFLLCCLNVRHWCRRLLVAFLLGVAAPFLSLAAASGSVAAPSPPHTLATGTPVVLYDGSLGTGTPDKQNMIYLTRPFLSVAARQSFADSVTTLTTTLKTSDIAGYSGSALVMPTLNRALGFTLHFTVQLLAESHAGSDKNGDGIGDRAGLDVTLLGSDHKGIELGFWRDQIWAQEDGSVEPPPNTNTLFTHAESAPFNPMSRLIAYELTIQGDTYVLTSNNVTLLSGRVRDYSAGGFPYTSGNFTFLGDNSGSANGRIRLAYISIVANSAATATPTPSATSTPPATTASPTPPISATPTSPISATTPEPVRVLVPVVQRGEP